MWTGKLLHIHIAKAAGEKMQELPEATLTAGVGIDGDRYALGTGTYSPYPDIREVTLFESETLEALSRDHDIDLFPHEHRRNLTTEGVPLNHLVGRTFRVGAVTLVGGRLNIPCRYLERVTDKRVYALLKHRSGLNCRILQSGTIAQGDDIRPV